MDSKSSFFVSEMVVTVTLSFKFGLLGQKIVSIKTNFMTSECFDLLHLL